MDSAGNQLTLSGVDIQGLNPEDHYINEIDMKHWVSICAVCKVLVDKGIISRQELLDAEEAAKDHIVKIANNSFGQFEDRQVEDAKVGLPAIYADSHQYKYKQKENNNWLSDLDL
jgi:hypothetical protein